MNYTKMGKFGHLVSKKMANHPFPTKSFSVRGQIRIFSFQVGYTTGKEILSSSIHSMEVSYYLEFIRWSILSYVCDQKNEIRFLAFVAQK